MSTPILRLAIPPRLAVLPRFLLPVIMFATFGAIARADEALVAVAANFAGAAQAIADAFSAETGHSVQLTTGSTGKLYAQIVEGAPFDILLSADTATPLRIAAEGLGSSDSSFVYALGGLSLYSRDEARIGTNPVAALTADDVLFIAIANPDLAPYGVAAQEALQSLGVWENISTRIVMGQNIGQTFSLVDTGAAQLGLIATSALQGPNLEPRGSRYDLPQDLFNPITQSAILLYPGAENTAAIAFLDYLQGDVATGIIGTFGYGTD